jgi:hypothetical protein
VGDDGWLNLTRAGYSGKRGAALGGRKGAGAAPRVDQRANGWMDAAGAD